MLCYKEEDIDKYENSDKKRNEIVFYFLPKNLNYTNRIENESQTLSNKEKNKIIYQMKKCVCKIISKKINIGSGFFCNIPVISKYAKAKYIAALITNNQILGKNDISPGSTINFLLVNNDNIKSIEIGDRLAYTSEKYNITIIELKKSDKLDELDICGIKIDNNIFEDNSEYKKLFNEISVYTLHFLNLKNIYYSIGKINKIKDDFNLEHTCLTISGTSGGPIINLKNFEVIAIHNGENIKKFNLGTILKEPIYEFQNRDISKNFDYQLEDNDINENYEDTFISKLFKI